MCVQTLVLRVCMCVRRRLVLAYCPLRLHACGSQCVEHDIREISHARLECDEVVFAQSVGTRRLGRPRCPLSITTQCYLLCSQVVDGAAAAGQAFVQMGSCAAMQSGHLLFQRLLFCLCCLCAGKDDDLAKLAFTKAACSKPDPFAVPMECDVGLNNTLQWLSSKSSMEVWQHSCNASPSFFCLLFQVNEYRKGVINKIEALAAVSCCSTFSCACALHAIALRFLRRSTAPVQVPTCWQEHPIK